MDKNFNYNCFTDSNYFNQRILELTEKGELAALLFLFIRKLNSYFLRIY